MWLDIENLLPVDMKRSFCAKLRLGEMGVKPN